MPIKPPSKQFSYTVAVWNREKTAKGQKKMVKSENRVDVKENSVMELDSELLTILLQDKSSGKNIIWATEDYSEYGYGFGKADEIYVRLITGANGNT